MVWRDSRPGLRIAALPVAAKSRGSDEDRRDLSGGSKGSRTGLQREGSDVDDDLWPGLKDDEEDPDGASDSVELEVLVELTGVGDLVRRARQCRHVVDTGEQRLKLGRRLEGEPREERRRELAGLDARFRGLRAWEALIRRALWRRGQEED